MVAGQFLGSGYHLLSTDDTHIVRGLQVLRSCIWVAAKDKRCVRHFSIPKMHVVHVCLKYVLENCLQGVHVANGSSRHYGIRYSLLKLPGMEKNIFMN